MGCPPCNFPVSLSKDEVFLEEALLNLQAMTPHQQERGSFDREEEAWEEPITLYLALVGAMAVF